MSKTGQLFADEVDAQCTAFGSQQITEIEFRERMARFGFCPAKVDEYVEALTPPEVQMTDDQIKHMVDRFLGWRLPENFSPDGGVSFTKHANKGTPHQHTYQPSGTNLLDGEQATAMVRYMLEELPDDRATQGGDWLEHSNQTARKP